MVTFVGVNNKLNNQSSATLAVPYPSGISAGDALILVAVNSSPTSFTNTPSGWTRQQSNASVDGDLAAYVFTKQAAGNESGTVSLSLSSAVSAGAILCYTDVADSPFGDTAAATGNSSTSSPTSGGALSPTPGPYDLVVRCYCWSENDNNSGTTLGNPSGWTARFNDVTSSDDYDCGMVLADNTTQATTGISSSQEGAWFVVDIDLAGKPPTSNQFMPFFGVG